MAQKYIGYTKPSQKLAKKWLGVENIYLHGTDNLYPYFLKNAVLGSPTASLAHGMHSRNIAKGLEIEDFVINKRKGLYLSNINDAISADLSIFNSFAIHVNYGYDADRDSFFPTNPTVIPMEDIRINKEDDHGYYSKIFAYDFWKGSRKSWDNKANVKWYYKYNPDKDVILTQIKKDAEELGLDLNTEEGINEALRNFRGQIRLCNYTGEFPYPTSKADVVMNDCISEYLISRYTIGQAANGFLGKAVAFVKKGTNEDDEDTEEDLMDWLGAEGASGIYVKFVNEVDDIEKIMKVVDFKPVFDDALFEKTEKRLQNNILGAFDNLPKILVYSGEGALFGTNPETWENAEKFYYSNTQPLRDWKNKMLIETLQL